MSEKKGFISEFLERVIGVCFLRGEKYREIIEDPEAVYQGASVVIGVSAISAFSGFIGRMLLLRMGKVGRLSLSRFTLLRIFFSKLTVPLEIVITVLLWIIGTAVVWWFSRVLGGKRGFKDLLSLTGYSEAPLILGIARAIPVIGRAIFFIGVIWTLCCWIYSVKEACELETYKVVAVFVMTGIVLLIILAVTIASIVFLR